MFKLLYAITRTKPKPLSPTNWIIQGQGKGVPRITGVLRRNK